MRTGFVIKFAIGFIGFATLGSLLLVILWHADLKSVLAIVAAVLCGSLIIAAVIGWYWLFQSRGKSIVYRWAAREGYAIVKVESPFATGEFDFATTSKGQVVYLVTVRDSAGMVRKAWVRCGGYWSSVLFSDQIEIKWDDEAKIA